MKINTDGNTPMEGIVTFTMFPVYTLTSFLASLSGHSSSYIELQQNAIERAFLWWTHNTQELVINMFNHNSQELFLLTSLLYINNSYDIHTWAGYSSLLSFCLYTSSSLTFSISPTLRRSTQLKSGISPGLPRRVSHTNTLWTLPFSLSCCFIHLSLYDRRSSGSLSQQSNA